MRVRGHFVIAVHRWGWQGILHPVLTRLWGCIFSKGAFIGEMIHAGRLVKIGEDGWMDGWGVCWSWSIDLNWEDFSWKTATGGNSVCVMRWHSSPKINSPNRSLIISKPLILRSRNKQKKTIPLHRSHSWRKKKKKRANRITPRVLGKFRA